MTELKELKQSFLEKSFQILIIDLNKKIVESCNSLVDLSDYYLEPAFEVIPFLEGIFSTLEYSAIGESVTMECVNMNFGDVKGVFDLKMHKEFYKGEVVAICMLEDRTELYKYWLKIQQERNNSLIHSELVTKHAAAIKAKNDQIEASINYARHIQQGILPEIKLIQSSLPESFIIFEPRDAIGGDFYWLQSFKKRVYFSAIDCTGHGVPGALMSMVSASLLDKAVSKNNSITPSEILSKVRNGVISFLSQKDGEHKHSDGLDAALCCWNKESNQIDFSGANNPLVVVRSKEMPDLEIQKGGLLTLEPVEVRFESDTHRLYEVKGDSIPVGYYTETLKPFTNCRMQLYEGDMIYSYSDGFKDQFGGPRTKRLGNKNFLAKLLEGAPLNPVQQKRFLLKTLADWQGEEDQVDDICVIGVRID